LKAYVYVKIAFAAALTAILFWEDLTLIPQRITSEWAYGLIAFALVILAGATIYRARKAVKTLLFISKSKNSYGAVLLLASLVVYLAKGYIQLAFPNLLFAFSTSLFVASLVTFLLDYRVVREFPLIFVALPFMLLPVDQAVEFRTVSYLLGTVALASLTLDLAKTFRVKKGEKCQLCSSAAKKENFCPFCGKQLLTPTFRPRRTEIVKILAIAFLVFMLLYSFVPIAALNEYNVEAKKYAWSGVKSESILVAPDGWVLSSSKRLTDYAKQNREDYAGLYVYQSSGKCLPLLLEIGPHEPYLMNHWQLPGWRRVTFLENIPVTGQVYGKCYVLLEINRVRGRFLALRTIVVLRLRTLTYLFNENGTFTAKKVGISVFMNFSRPIKDAQVVEALEPLKVISASAVKRLQYLQSWTARVSTLDQICRVSRDALLSVAAVITLFLVAWFARRRDHEVGETVEKYSSLSEDESTVLAAVIRMRNQKFTGKQLFEKLPKLTREKLGPEEFCSNLKKLESKGFLKRDLTVDGSDLLMVWSSTL